MPTVLKQIDNPPRTITKLRSSAIGSLESTQRSTGRSTGEPSLEQWEHKLDQEWQARLRCLEQWLSRLLVKNEQLRMSLALAGTSGRGEMDQRLGENLSRDRPIQIDEP